MRRTSQRWDFRSRLASWYHGFSRARATLDVCVLCAGNLGSLAILLPAQQQYFENDGLGCGRRITFCSSRARTTPIQRALERAPAPVETLVQEWRRASGSLEYTTPPVLSTCPLHTNSGCGKEGRILIGPW